MQANKKYKTILCATGCAWFFLLIASTNSVAQKTDSAWFKLVQKAESLQFKKSFDSALIYSLQAITIAENKNYHSDVLFSILLSNTGYSYEKKMNPEQAHVYYTRSLNNARKYNHIEEKRSAFISLNQLHFLILKNNWAFNYTSPIVTVEADVFYKIEKVNNLQDSIELTIIGGKIDGITELSLAGIIYTRRSLPKDSINREGGIFIGTAKIKSISDNRTTLIKPKNGDTLPLTGDLVKINSVVPISWNSLGFKTSVVNNVIWVDNYRQRIYDRRYLYYFQDSSTNNDIADALKNSVEEVLPMIADDSAKGKQFSYHINNGVFTGLSLYKALEISRNLYFNFFQNYALHYIESYRGNDYKFSEVYATWVINNAPLLAEDIKDFLLRAGKQKQTFSRYLKSEIIKEKLTDKWFDDAMQLAHLNDIKQARAIAKVLYDYGEGTRSASEKGWACYLEAICLHKLGDNTGLDSLLTVAAQYFTADNNKEGMWWVKNGRETLFAKPQVSFTVQSGHLMSFKIAMSPNSRYFATGSDDHQIKIWDIYNAKEVKTIAGHSNEVTDVIYSPGGRYLASCSDDSTIKIWNSFNYGLMQTIRMKKLDGKIIFSPDTKKIISIGADSGVRVWDIFSGQLLHTFEKHKGRLSDITFHPLQPNLLISAGRDSMLYYWSIDSMKSEGYIKTKGRVVRSRFSNNGKFLYMTFTDSSMTVWKADPYAAYFTRKIQAGRVLNTTFLTQPYFSPDSKYLFYVDDKGRRVIEDVEALYYRTYALPGRKFLQEQYLNKDGSFLVEKSGGDNQIKITDFSNYSFQKGFDNVNTTEIKQYQNPPVGLQFSQNDSSLFVLSMQLSKFNLFDGTTEPITSAPQPYHNENLILKDEAFATAVTYQHDSVNIINYATKEIVRSYPGPLNEKIRTFKITHAEDVCFIGTEQGSLSAWDMLNDKNLYTVNFATKEDSIIQRIYYDSIYRRLFLFLSDSVLVVNPVNGKLIKHFRIVSPDYMTFSKDKIYISSDTAVSVFSNKTLSYLKKLPIKKGVQYFSTMAYSDRYDKLVVAAEDARIFVVDGKTDRTLYSRKDNYFEVSAIKFNHDNSMLAVAAFNNVVNVYDFTSGKLLFNINTPLGDDFVISDSLGYYMSPKKSLNGIVFNYNNSAYDFEQFDLQYNRPDIILKKIGKADSALIQSYHLAYKKRLQKAGLTGTENTVEFNLPVVRIQDLSTVRPVTSSSEYNITVECYEPKYKLQSIHVLVNNTPMFGAKGYQISSLDTFQVIQKFAIPLSIGNNSIKIYCINDKGVASLKETFDVFSNYQPKQKGKTYFIGIAVAEYKDSSMNLTYSAKDVRDLAVAFKEIYPTAEIDTLINATATRENIFQLRKRLEQTTVNDKIIMAVTGHGLLSDSLDFYYATYDIDFKDPVKRGLKYDDLENLLNDIPARQKLLLIDACHSGALDKETMLSESILSTNSNNDGVKVVGNRSNIKIKKSKVSLNNTFDLMQTLFADLSNNSGTVVISAAGGLEYAFESPEWNNGVFTYCVRNGLKEADRDGGNFDFNVSVQELQQYVSRKVSELTNGRQKPTSRRENIDYDWTLK